jgi:uncharacterized protein
MRRSRADRLDPFDLAKRGGYWQGKVRLQAMHRLKEAVEGVGERQANADLNFSMLNSSSCLLKGRVNACVLLICQRCLEPVALEIDRNVELALVRSEAEAASIQTEYEAYQLESGDTFLIQDFVEEELLLSLPIVPMHADKAQCNQTMLQILESNSGDQIPKTKKSPFSALKDLKQD